MNKSKKTRWKTTSKRESRLIRGRVFAYRIKAGKDEKAEGEDNQMSDSEIIEYEGRRFMWTGERRFPKKGEWLFAEGCQHPILSDHDWETLERSILRELPAETPASGLLAEAEEAISRLIGMVVTMQNLHGDHITKFIIDSQPFNWAQAVLARIRAAKEKP